MPDACVTTGIYSVRDEEHIPGPLLEDPRFGHCIVKAKRVDSGDERSNTKTTRPVREQLTEAVTTEQALEIIKGRFFLGYKALRFFSFFSRFTCLL